MAPVGSLAYAGSATGALTTAADKDAFTVTLAAGQTVAAIVRTTTATSPRLTASLAGPDGTTLGTATAAAASGPAAVQAVTAATAGTYTLTVGSASGYGPYSVQFFLDDAVEAETFAAAGSDDRPASAQPLDPVMTTVAAGVARGAVTGVADGSVSALSAEAEPNDYTGAANYAGATFAPYAAGDRYQLVLSGALASGTDVDTYGVGAMQPGDVLTLSGASFSSDRGSYQNVGVFLYRSGSTTPVASDTLTAGSGYDGLVYRYAVTTADTYFAVVKPIATAAYGTYQLALWLENAAAPPTTGGTVAAEAEPNDTPATATNASASWRAVNYKSSTAATFSSRSDFDYYAYTLSAGDVVTVDVRDTGTATGRPALSLLNAAGTTVGLEDGTSAGMTADSVLYAFPIATAGTYYLRALPYSGSGTYSADVYLSTTVAPPAPGPLPDVYAVTLQAGVANTFALAGAGATLSVIDAAGNVLATGAANGSRSLTAQVSGFVPPTTGTYYLQVTGPAGAAYTLVATTGAGFESEPNDTLATAQPINRDTSVLGAIATAADADAYGFDAAAGATVTVTASPDNGPADTLAAVVQLYDPSGTLVAIGNGQLAFTATVAGLYTARVTGGNGTAGEYLLTVTADRPPTFPPAAPVLAAAADTGASASDSLTSFNDATAATALRFTVGGTVAGDVVELFIDGVAAGTATATGTVTAVTASAGPALLDGTHTVTARRVSASTGVESRPSAPLTVTVRTAAPATPAAPVLTPASDTGAADGVTAVTVPTFAVRVSTPYYRVYQNGVQVSGDYASAFYFTVPAALADGTYAFAVAAVDAAGNVSAAGPATLVTVAAAPPAGVTKVVLDAGSDTGVSNADGITNAGNPTVDVTAAGPGTLHVAVDGNVAGATTVPVAAAGTVAVPLNYRGAVTGYSTAAVVAVGPNPVSTATADVNGDGHPDLIVGSAVRAGVTVFLGDGTGAFGPGRALSITAAGGVVRAVAAADLNGDGRADLVAATSLGPPQVFYGNGDGTFAAPAGPATGPGDTSALVIGDFDGDGRPDLATGGPAAVTVYLATGPTAYAAPVTVAVPAGTAFLAAGDFDRDGRDDLVAANQAGNTVSVVRSTGNGTFAPAATVGTLKVAAGVAVGDVNNDGLPDVVAASAYAGTLTTFLGRGDATFSPTAMASGHSAAQDVVLADLNGDGKLDAAVDITSAYTAGVAFLNGNGDGTFGSVAAFTTTSARGTAGLTAADLNGDGLPELVAADAGGGTTVTAYAPAFAGLGDGVHTVTAWVTNTAGAASAAASTKFTLLRTVPDTPSRPALFATSDSGASAYDGITNVTTPTLGIETSVPYYRVYRNGVLVSGPYVTGAYSGSTFTSAPLADGTYVFTFAVVDTAGNVSAPSPGVTVVVDTVPPAVPPAPTLAAASDSGVSAADGVTNVSAPTLAVAAGDAPYYRLFRDGTLVGTSYATGPTVALATLADGTYAFTVQAVDAAGNASVAGPAATVTVDTRSYTMAAVDPSFGTNGSTLTSRSGADAVTGLIALPGGGFLAVARVGPPQVYPSVPSALAGMARYTADGKPDPTFGTNGLIVSTLDSATIPGAVAVTPDGKYVVVGEVDHVLSSASWTAKGYVARYNADGTLDATFGTGGWTTVAAGVGRAVAVQPDGKVVVAGAVGLERLTAAGAVDTAFGINGIQTGSDYYGLEYRSLALLADGQIVFAGDSPTPGSSYSSRFAVGRLTAAGQFDPTFGKSGVAVSVFGTSTNAFNYLNGVAVQPDGKVVAAGWGQGFAGGIDAAVVLRFTAAGAADSTFGTLGFTTVTLGTGNAALSSVAVRPDGRLVVAGTVANTPAVAELEANGSPTLAFGPTGSLQLPATPFGGSLATLVVQADGSLVVGGTAFTSAAASATAAELSLSRVLMPFTLAAPALAPTSDSGTVGDGITNVATPTLTFAVPAGHYARVYRDGVLVSGNYAAGGPFTSAALADGQYAFTYAIVDAAGNVSAASAAATVTVRTAGPTAAFATVPNAAGVATVGVTFTEPVYGLTPASFTLTRDGGPNLLDGSQTLTTGDNVNWTVGNLAAFDVAGGTYVLSLVPAAVTDAAGNPLAAAASTSWSVANPAALHATADGQAFYFRLDPTGTAVQAWTSATPVGNPAATYSLAAFAAVTVAGDGHARLSVVLDESNGVVPTTSAAPFVDGGAGATGDQLIVYLPSGGGAAGVNGAGVPYVATAAGTPVMFPVAHVGGLTFRGTAAADRFVVAADPGATVTVDGGGGGGDSVDVSAGPATLVPGTYGAVTVAGPTATLTLAAGPAGGGVAVTRLGGLAVTGRFAMVTPAAAADRSLLVVDALTLSATGRLDLGGNDAVVHDGSAAALTAAAARGFANGSWTGPGLDSWAAAADPRHLTGVGVVANAAAAYPTFDGVPVVAADVLLKVTYYGDVNLDGVVTAADYTRVDVGFVTGLTGWANGDFTYDGVVDGTDYAVMDNAFNQQGPTPSPAALVATPSAVVATVAPVPSAQPRDIGSSGGTGGLTAPTDAWWKRVTAGVGPAIVDAARA